MDDGFATKPKQPVETSLELIPDQTGGALSRINYSAETNVSIWRKCLPAKRLIISDDVVLPIVGSNQMELVGPIPGRDSRLDAKLRTTNNSPRPNRQGTNA